MIFQALKLFEKCEYEATKGMHLAPKFEGFLSCVQMRIFSTVMMECASNIENITCFLPIHLLSVATKANIQRIITSGFSIIIKRAETKKWNGKKTITAKTQNVIDPFLSALYNTYSLSGDLTNPYEEGMLPDSVKFTIDITYIAEGEEDSCKLEVIIHEDLNVTVFVWKELKKEKLHIYIRYEKITWTMPLNNGNLFEVEYHISENKMSTASGEMEKIVGWPKQRMSVSQMIEEVELKRDGKLSRLSKITYKWIQHVSEQYLASLNIDLDNVNEDGISILHLLAEIKGSKFLRCIMKKIRNIDPIDSSGQTPLHRACVFSRYKSAKVLLEHGADVNIRTKTGDTPLMILAGKRKTKRRFYKLLLDFNAKRETENNESMRAVDIARMSDCPSNILKLLQPM